MNETPPPLSKSEPNLGTLVFPIADSAISASIAFPTNLSDKEAEIIGLLIRSFADASRMVAAPPPLDPYSTIQPPYPGNKVEYTVTGMKIGEGGKTWPEGASQRAAAFDVLPSILRDVYGNVVKHVNKAPGVAVPIALIADRLGGVSESYIRKIIASLIELGWLRRTGRGKLEVAR